MKNISKAVVSRRLLLSELRGGDYAHAGEEEAIDLVLKKALFFNPNLKSGKVLDVGCDFGGTLHYLVSDLSFISSFPLQLHYAFEFMVFL